jgi:hypothetical protein
LNADAPADLILPLEIHIKNPYFTQEPDVAIILLRVKCKAELTLTQDFDLQVEISGVKSKLEAF